MNSLRIDLHPPRRVALSEIDFADATWRIRPPAPPPAVLADSLARTGMLTPPVLVPVNDTLRVVCGFRRLEAWRALGREAAAARVLPEATAEADLARLVLADNGGAAALNVVEQAALLARIETFADEDALAEIWLPALGRKPAPSALERLRRVAASPPAVRRALADGRLNESAVDTLRFFEAGDRQRALDAVLDLRLSVGAARDFLRDLLDVSRRDGDSPAAVLEAIGAAAEDGRDSPERRQHVLDALRRRRRPVLARLLEDSRRAHEALGLPSGARIVPPRDFEGDAWRLEATLGGAEDVRRFTESLLRRLDENPEAFDAFFDPEAREP